MATDRELLKTVQTGHALSAGLSDARGEVQKSHRRTIRWRKATADGNAGDNTAEFSLAYLPRACKLVSAKWTTDANVTAANATCVNLFVAKRDGAGGAASNVASVNTATSAGGGTGNLVLFVPADVPRIAANADSIAAGSVLTFTINKTSTGTVLQAGELAVDLEEI
jgi:hypothetical protein